MKNLIETFSSQIEEAIRIGESINLPPLTKDIHNIAVFGLGGSAFGAEIVKDYVYDKINIPFTIYRGYTIPAALNSKTLAIFSSYSGNTEETLSAAHFAIKEEPHTVCITSGGLLQQYAIENKYGIINLPAGYPPRSACGFSIIQQLYTLFYYNLITDFRSELDEALRIIKNFNDHELCKNLAQALHNKIPVFYCSDTLESIAIRFRQQINENAKQLCWHHVVPEMNHNELVGWELPAVAIQNSAVVFIQSSFDNPRVKLRFDINKGIIEKVNNNNCYLLSAKGSTLLAQLFYYIHFADWVSLYLAELNNVDPTPVKVIDYLKNELSSVH
jgi:glucose/mannose-6-phosphate isomerase